MLASTALLLTSIYWAVWLILAPSPWSPMAAVLIGTGTLAVATVAGAGILVERSRLAYRIGWGLLMGLGLLMLLRPLSPTWFIALFLSGLSGLAMTNRTLAGWIPSEPPAAPVPKPAVALALLLLTTPSATATASAGQPMGVLPALALACWLVLYWYVRRLPGAMVLLRLGLPILAVTGWWLPARSRLVWIILLAGASAMAWRSATRLAVRPLVEQGSRVAIPLELVPEDIRRALEVDPSDR